jgi:hypothetical protein
VRIASTDRELLDDAICAAADLHCRTGHRWKKNARCVEIWIEKREEWAMFCMVYRASD